MDPINVTVVAASHINVTANLLATELRRLGWTANIVKAWPHRFQIEIVNKKLQRTEHYIDRRKFWRNGDRRDTWVFGKRNNTRFPAADDGSYNVSGMAQSLLREHVRLIERREADLALSDRYASGKALLETFVDRRGGDEPSTAPMLIVNYSLTPGRLHARLETNLTLEQALQLHALARSFVISNQQEK